MSAKPLIFSFIMFVSSVHLMAQGLEGFDAAANMSGSTNHMFRSFDNRYEGVRGYPTLFKEFVTGDVRLKGGYVAKKQELNFDVLTSELLVKTKKLGNNIMVVRGENVDGFTLVDDDGIEMNFVKIKTDAGNYFFQVLYEGKITLFKKYSKIIENANFGGAYNNNSRKYDEFVSSTKYFVRFEGAEVGALQEMKPTRRDVERLFPEKEASIKDYFKNEKPNLKNDNQLSSLFRYLDGV